MIDDLQPSEVVIVLEIVNSLRSHPIDFVMVKGVDPMSIKSGLDALLLDGISGARMEGSVLVARMLSTIPHDDPTMEAWNELIGPFYDTAALTLWLGVSKQAINKRIGKSLLAVRAANGDIRYPSFQFLDDGRVIPNLMTACQRLAKAGLDEWAQAQWVNTPVPELAGRTIADTLATELAADTALALKVVAAQAARLAA